MTDDEILDDVHIAHELRHLLWENWGERAVPVMWQDEIGYHLKVRGTDATYLVTISVSTP